MKREKKKEIQGIAKRRGRKPAKTLQEYKRENERLRMEKEVRAKVKYAVIYRHRDKHPIGVMCEFFHVSRSGYYSCVKRLNRPEKDAAPAEMIRRQQEQCFHTYGCRRMWQWLKSSEGVYRNPKTILRIMKKYGLLAEIRRRRRWRQPDSPAAALDSYRSIRTYDGVYTDFGTRP